MEKFFTITESCELARVSPKTIRRAYLCGELRAFQRVPNGKVLIRETDLVAWLESRTTTADFDPAEGVQARQQVQP
ncbi:MAG: hypothetical protein JWR52_3496 [Marmoricola sp.]|nr:hypothetical protein [Marmoricola sp.]